MSRNGEKPSRGGAVWVVGLLALAFATSLTGTASAQTKEADKRVESLAIHGLTLVIAATEEEEADAAWEGAGGEDLVIEVTETTIGSDEFQTSSPGQTEVGTLTLDPDDLVALKADLGELEFSATTCAVKVTPCLERLLEDEEEK